VSLSKVSQPEHIAWQPRATINHMKTSWQAKIVLVLLSIAAVTASSQQPIDDRDSVQETQARDYWIDPSTGLMWTGKDNGADMNWRKATEYCKNLQLAGYSDWRLPSIEELEGIHQRNAKAPGEVPKSHKREAFFYTFEIKGNIFLTGNPWSASRIDDDPSHPPEFGWFVYFNEGSRIYEKLSDSHSKRALCVRSSGVVPTARSIAGVQTTVDSKRLADEIEARRYWVDPSTGLMWAWRDNGEDVTWGKAMKYCRDSRLAGYSDWRLPNLAELEGIYDKSAESRGENPKSYWHEAEPMNFHVKGNLFLTGDQWSSPQIPDDRGKPSGYAWRFDFNEGRSFDGDEVSFDTNKRALCVRGSSK
jgi:hypothetical protein